MEDRYTMTATTITQTRAVLELVLEERKRQEARYGEVNETTVSGSGPNTRWLLPYTNDSAAKIQAEVRADYEDFQEEAGGVTWVHLVREEIAEAFELPDDDPRLIDELVQVAALCVSWIERLQVRGPVAPENRLWVEGEVAQA